MIERETGTQFGTRTMLTRRRFLAGVTVAAGAAILAACGGGSSATDTPKPAASTSGTAAPAGGTTGTAASAASAGKPIKGTEITILWMAPSIQAAADIQEKNMDDWA